MYNKTITHHTRIAIIIAIDCSISMNNWTTLSLTKMHKSEAAALLTNHIIDELLIRSTRYTEIIDYFDISVIGYSGDGVESLLPDDGFMHITRLADYMPQPQCFYLNQRLNDRKMVSTPITLHPWITPKACGETPMYEAMIRIKSLARAWTLHPHNRDSFPPIIINISDGGFSDADNQEMLDIAYDIRQTSTSDGKVLFINIFLATNHEQRHQSYAFPSKESFHTNNEDCQTLYDMSSTLPFEFEPAMRELLIDEAGGPYKCFAYNNTVSELFAILDIGTENSYSLKHNNI